jgi:predicted NBD/HSP70 family sugar kinase
MASLIFVARFDSERMGCAICTLDGTVLSWEDQRRPYSEEGEVDGIRELDQMLSRLLASGTIDRSRIQAMVVSVNGPVSDLVRTVPWSRVGVLPSDLADHFSMKVTVENDANLMALGAQRALPDADSLMFLLVETGIGAGVVVSGQLHRGLGGWAGEVGHIPIAAAGDTPCNCGNRGCLALVASNPSLMRAISTTKRPVETVEELRRLVLAGDTDAIVALREAGRNIGEAITGMVIGLAPDVIMVGGNIAELGDHVIAGIRESIAQRTPPALSSRVNLQATKEYLAHGIRGATDVAFDLLLGAPV